MVTAPLLVASDHMFPLFVSGLHFGILLICLYLTLQMFVSASFVTLLVVGVAWILGIILNMKFAVPRSLSASMGVLRESRISSSTIRQAEGLCAGWCRNVEHP